jgi:hypothetical protein
MSELLDVMVRFKKAQLPEKAMQSLQLIFASVNINEALPILSSIQKEAPKNIFMEVAKIAQQVMSTDNWEKISAKLWTQEKSTLLYLKKSPIFSTESKDKAESEKSESVERNIHDIEEPQQGMHIKKY